MKKRTVFWLTLLSLTVLLASPVTVPAQDTQGPAPMRPEQLDQMLAPIALYPDSLLSQILMASTYPLEVVEADRWVKANPGLKGQQLDDAVQKQDWDVSVKSLAYFPDVLAMMSDKLDWTSKLGDTFLAQQKDVMDSIQHLRTKAKASGNLKTTKQQKVVVEQQAIKIEPADPQVVYVPVYNPTVVYGPWWYPAYPPVVAYPPGYVATAGLVGFTAGFFAGAACFGAFNWGGGDVVINNNNFYNHNNDWNHHHPGPGPGPGPGPWHHDPYHRKGQLYKDPASARQYGQKGAMSADARKNVPRNLSGEGKQSFRGHEPDNAMRNPGNQAMNRPGAGHQPQNAFGNYGNGKNEWASSQRGQTSRNSDRYMHEAPQARGGGEFSRPRGDGGGSHGGGGFHGGGGGHRR